MLFSVMGNNDPKNQMIDYLNGVDKAVRVRDLQQQDFAAVGVEEVYMDERDEYESPTHEDCGWFGYEGLCED